MIVQYAFGKYQRKILSSLFLTVAMVDYRVFYTTILFFVVINLNAYRKDIYLFS